MVESKARNGASSAALDLFGKAAEVAFLAELTKAELQTVLDTKYRETTFKVANNGHAVADYVEPPCGGFPLPDDVPIYTELPEGLIDLPSAVKKYGLKPRTVQDWVKNGHVPLRGRFKAATRSGGYLVVSEDELVDYISAPRNRGGRPRKELIAVLEIKNTLANNSYAVVDYAVSPQRRFTLPDDVLIYTYLPEGFITVRDAAKKYGINHSTLRSWLRRGYLQLCGRLKAPSPGGGYAVIDEHQLLSHIELRRRPGRPPN